MNDRSESTPAQRRRSALLATVSVAVGLTLGAAGCVAAELGYRLWRTRSLSLSDPMYVSDSLLGYRLNPERVLFRTSFLGEGFPVDRRGLLLVACLGGSTTFGHAVSAAQAWPGVMRDTLSALHVNAAVVNAGVSGYGSRQLLLRYRSQIAGMKPDIVIIFEGWNRTGILSDSSAWEPFGTGVAGPLGRSLVALSRHSLLVRAVLARSYRRRQLAAAEWRPDPFQAAWEADMDSLVREVVAHGQRAMVILYPSLYHDGMTSAEVRRYERLGWKGRAFRRGMLDELRSKHGALRRIATQEGVALVDAHGAFSGVSGPQRMDLFLDEMHPSVAGHARVGGLVAHTLAGMSVDGGAADRLTQPVGTRGGSGARH